MRSFGIPILGASAHAEHKIRQDLVPLRRMHYFRMKLNSHQWTIAMRHCRHSAGCGSGKHVEAVRHSLDLIAMVHPHLRVAIQIREKRMRLCSFKDGQPIFALRAFSNMTAQFVRHQLLAITDAEHRAALGENGGIDTRAIAFVDAIRTSRDNQSLCCRAVRAPVCRWDATSAYTPRSRIFLAMRWQYWPPASRTVI